MRCRDLSRPLGCHRARDDKYEHDRNLHNERRPSSTAGRLSRVRTWCRLRLSSLGSTSAVAPASSPGGTSRISAVVDALVNSLFLPIFFCPVFSLGGARFADGFIRSNGCRPHAGGRHRTRRVLTNRVGGAALFCRASARDTAGKLPSPMSRALPSRLNRKIQDLAPVADICK